MSSTHQYEVMLGHGSKIKMIGSKMDEEQFLKARIETMKGAQKLNSIEIFEEIEQQLIGQ
jgi:hypothetical protein